MARARAAALRVRRLDVARRRALHALLDGRREAPPPPHVRGHPPPPGPPFGGILGSWCFDVAPDLRLRPERHLLGDQRPLPPMDRDATLNSACSSSVLPIATGRLIIQTVPLIAASCGRDYRNFPGPARRLLLGPRRRPPSQSKVLLERLAGAFSRRAAQLAANLRRPYKSVSPRRARRNSWRASRTGAARTAPSPRRHLTRVVQPA